MILYFSATGNSEYVAKRIADETNDIAVSVTDYYKHYIFSFNEKYDKFGIVSPTCSWGLPVSAIEMNDRKPKWIKEQCVMCLSCLHHCPKFAIQYGKRTKKHGQYTHSQ